MYDEKPADLSDLKADLSYSAAAKNSLLPNSQPLINIDEQQLTEAKALITAPTLPAAATPIINQINKMKSPVRQPILSHQQ